MKINENYSRLKENYLFATINSKVREFKEKNPNKKLINMGIGDVTKPLCKTIIEALKNSVDEMAASETFKGYGPYQGYDFLIRSFAKSYEKFNAKIDDDEIFISDGAKSDCANILDIFASNQTVLIPNPTYPAYLDVNIMVGNKVLFSDANEKNKFLPMPNENLDVDLIYICSPNNPTGATYDRTQLKKWVDYANERNAIILFDSAYREFISDKNLPKSIFEIEGAKTCAIEIYSLSKTAGFTGTRCGCTIVPKDLKRDGVSLNKMWMRHQTANFNGVAYIVQCGANATFSKDGFEQIKKNLDYYKNNAEIIVKTLNELNVWHTGGTNSPYIWFECLNKMKSWEFFDLLLNELQIVGTPGVGFGTNGEHFFRLTAFGDRNVTIESMAKLKELYSKRKII